MQAGTLPPLRQVLNVGETYVGHTAARERAVGSTAWAARQRSPTTDRLRTASAEQREARQREEETVRAEVQCGQRLRAEIVVLQQGSLTVQTTPNAALLREVWRRVRSCGHDTMEGRGALATVARMLGERRFDGW